MNDKYPEDEDEYYRRRQELRARRRQKRRRIRRIRQAAALLLFLLCLIFAARAVKGHFTKTQEASPKSAAVSEETAMADPDSPDEADLEETSENTSGLSESSSQEEETEQPEDTPSPEEETEDTPYQASDDLFFDGYSPSAEGAGWVGDDVVSSNAILVDLDSGKVVAQKDARTRINPASMTKILTILVAAEHIADLDDTVTITIDVTDYSYSNDCSAVGFSENEVVTVRDLMYGTILPSGADAAAALAIYVAGSLDAFTDLMNEKLEELGLSSTTHFTNCVGLYDADHYSTVYDMAMILKATEENTLCREILSTRIYTTSATTEHPEGIEISNWFLRRIEDKDTHGQVAGAKTGFVNESGSCAASYSVSNDGGHYICVTAGSTSSWRCIYDHVAIYQRFL